MLIGHWCVTCKQRNNNSCIFSFTTRWQRCHRKRVGRIKGILSSCHPGSCWSDARLYRAGADGRAGRALARPKYFWIPPPPLQQGFVPACGARGCGFAAASLGPTIELHRMGQAYDFLTDQSCDGCAVPAWSILIGPY